MLFSTNWDENSVNPHTPASLLFLRQTESHSLIMMSKILKGAKAGGCNRGPRGIHWELVQWEEDVCQSHTDPRSNLSWGTQKFYNPGQFAWPFSATISYGKKQYWIYSTVLRIKWGYDYKVVSIVPNKK